MFNFTFASQSSTEKIEAKFCEEIFKIIGEKDAQEDDEVDDSDAESDEDVVGEEKGEVDEEREVDKEEGEKENQYCSGMLWGTETSGIFTSP